MAKINWYLQIRNMAKTDKTAADIFELLQKAQTDDEKENAKQIAQKYIQETQNSENNPAEPTQEVDPVAEDETSNDEPGAVVDMDNSIPDNEPPIQENNETDTESKQEKILTDLSAPAFTPRLAKCGITREEELFLHGVFVRKMTREEKIEMRRSIYQKKTQTAQKIQAEYKKKRIEQKEKDANDPVKQQYHQERKFVSAIVNALENHCNIGWIFSHIEGLTVDIFKELIKKPGNCNAFRQANPNFLDNFKKKYND